MLVATLVPLSAQALPVGSSLAVPRETATEHPSAMRVEHAVGSTAAADNGSARSATPERRVALEGSRAAERARAVFTVVDLVCWRSYPARTVWKVARALISNARGNALSTWFFVARCVRC